MLADIKEKKIIGLVEIVKIIGSKGEIEAKALFDTGATRTSIDISLAAKAGLGPIIGSVKVKKAEGEYRRAVVKGKIEILGVKMPLKATLADRKGMDYPVLVGRDVIHSDFVIDPEKTHESHVISDLKKEKQEEFEDFEEFD